MHLPQYKLRWENGACTQGGISSCRSLSWLVWQRTLTNGNDVKYVFPRCRPSTICKGVDFFHRGRKQEGSRGQRLCFEFYLHRTKTARTSAAPTSPAKQRKSGRAIYLSPLSLLSLRASIHKKPRVSLKLCRKSPVNVFMLAWHRAEQESMRGHLLSVFQLTLVWRLLYRMPGKGCFFSQEQPEPAVVSQPKSFGHLS